MMKTVVAILAWTLIIYLIIKYRKKRKAPSLPVEVISDDIIKKPVASIQMICYPDTTQIDLPELKKDYGGPFMAKSESLENTKYEVDIKNLTCSCPGFQKRVESLRLRDIRRVDKHVVKMLIKTKAIEEFDEITQVIIGYEKDSRVASGGYKGVGAEHIHTTPLPSGMIIAFMFSLNKPWINVITKRRKKEDSEGFYTGAYSRYGYNLVENRWSYGGIPPGANLIKAKINELFDFEEVE